MAKLTYTVESRVDAGRLLAAATDVSERRRTFGAKGRLLGAIVQIFGTKMLPKGFAKTTEILERER
jgi:hypothetical protein